jgi:hypothetical protein
VTAFRLQMRSGRNERHQCMMSIEYVVRSWRTTARDRVLSGLVSPSGAHSPEGETRPCSTLIPGKGNGMEERGTEYAADRRVRAVVQRLQLPML